MERWLDIDGLADLLGVSRSWVRDKVTARELPHHRPGRHVRFTPEDVEAIAALTSEPVRAEPRAVASVTGIGRTHPPAGPSTPPPPTGPKERAA